MVYPESFAELYESRENYKHFQTDFNPEVLNLSTNVNVRKFADITEKVYFRDFMQTLEKIAKAETVSFAKGMEIASLNLFGPDSFVQLDEEYFTAQYCFLVNDKFPHHKKFVRM